MGVLGAEKPENGLCLGNQHYICKRTHADTQQERETSPAGDAARLTRTYRIQDNRQGSRADEDEAGDHPSNIEGGVELSGEQDGDEHRQQQTGSLERQVEEVMR